MLLTLGEQQTSATVELKQGGTLVGQSVAAVSEHPAVPLAAWQTVAEPQGC